MKERGRGRGREEREGSEGGYSMIQYSTVQHSTGHNTVALSEGQILYTTPHSEIPPHKVL